MKANTWDIIIVVNPQQAIQVGLGGGFTIQNHNPYPLKIFVTRETAGNDEGKIYCEKCKAFIELKR